MKKCMLCDEFIDERRQGDYCSAYCEREATALWYQNPTIKRNREDFTDVENKEKNYQGYVNSK